MSKNQPNRVFQAIKNFKWGYLLFAILFFAAGLGFIMFPEQAMEGVRITIGVIVIAFALFSAAMTLAKKERGFRFWIKMIACIFGGVCGGFALFSADLFSYLLVAFGLLMIIDGAFKFQTSILSCRYKFWLWWVMLVVAVVGIGMGTYLVRREFDFDTELVFAAYMIGAGFIVESDLNFMSIAYQYLIERGQRKELSAGTVAESAPASTESAPAPLPECGEATETGEATTEPKTE